jgi:DNA-binding SARP family transcriptional activator/nucleoid-associated protein YgaU
VVAQLRGRRRPSFASGPIQRFAGYLIGSVMMSIGPMTLPAGASVPTTFPSSLATGPAVTASAATTPPTAPAQQGATTPDAPAPAPVTTTVVVQRGDSPWSLAESHLGDGLRWRELWEMNKARVQPDGAVWSSVDGTIRPGWELEVPAAPGTPAAPAAASDAPGEVTVAPGDNFWALAEGDLQHAWGRDASDAEVAGHWQVVVDANADRLAPPGDPDLIFPGQSFSMPAAPADPAAPPAPATPPVVPEAPVPPPVVPEAPVPPPVVPEAPDVPVPDVTVPDAATPPVPESGDQLSPDQTTMEQLPDEPAPADDAADDPPGDRGSAPTAPATTDAPADRPAEADAGDDATGLVPVGLAGGGVALAGVLLLLERRRRAQQRHRRRGREVALPPPAARAGEEALRSGADVDGARLLDLALRAAAAGAGAAGMLPLRWAEVAPGAVLLVLAAPAPPPPGFTAVGPDRWVTNCGPEALAAVADHPASPAPTLIPVGTTLDDTQLLIELEASTVVSTAGPPDSTIGLLRAMATAAATSPWSEQPRVTIVGMGGELTELPWVRSVDTLAEALDEAEAHAARVAAALRSVRTPSLSQARAAGVTPEAWDPLVVVNAVRPHDRDEVRRLGELAARPYSGVGVITLPAMAVGIPGRMLTIGPDGWLRAEGVDVPVRPLHLAGDDSLLVNELLDLAAQRGDVAAGSAAADLGAVRLPPPPPPPPPAPAAEATVTPLAPTPGQDPAGAAPAPPRRLEQLMGDVDVIVRVLGPVESVRRHDAGEEPLVPTRQRALEAIAYLALRDAAVDRESLEISLFPSGSNSAKTIYNTVSSARTLLGDDLFPPPEGGRYELSDRVVTDYGLFCELVAEADETEDAAAAADLLAEALDLVRGEPFTGVGRGYAWVGPHRGMIVAQVVDAAEELAEVRLATGDWRSAEWAARQGLRAFPSDERMYRLLMRTARAAGNVPGVQRVFRELCDVLADPDFGVEPEDTLHPETIELLEELTGTRTQRDRRGA